MKAQQWKAQGPFVMQAGPMEAWQLLVCVVPSTVDPKPTPDAAAKSKEQAQDYARLIAAAPEMLKVLGMVERAFNVEQIDAMVAFVTMEKVRGIIAMALGKGEE